MFGNTPSTAKSRGCRQVARGPDITMRLRGGAQWSWRRLQSLARRAALFGAVATIMTAGLIVAANAAAAESEARAFFVKFVAAQNAHNVGEVKAMLWESPDMLWFTRGVEVRGPDAVADRLKDYYGGTWHLEPDMTQFRVTVIANDFIQILVPIVFTRGLPGKPPQDSKFLISQTLVRGKDGWRVAAIMPIADTQLK
jgi:hypothetical protein